MSLSTLPDRAYSAFLFDMDGTLLSSVRSAERVWGAWARRHGLDVDAFLRTIHGVRARETVLSQNIPGIDVDAEVEAITRAEMEDLHDIDALAGASDLLASLPRDRWAIVTSASLELACRRLTAAGLPMPPMFITAEDVERGKPAPDCFQLAARRLGVDPRDCLVFEDAAAGIQAAEAAGASVIVICTTHPHPMDTVHPMIDAYAEVRAVVDERGDLRIVLRD